MSFVLVSSRNWHKNTAAQIAEKTGHKVTLITSKEDFSYQNLQKINPKYVFIPHWSHIIPKDIFSNFNCIIFHMTDLPYGRGGSPLQNLIINGHKNTKISAIKCVEQLDAGDIYLKKDLSLQGTAEEIFKKAAIIVEEMILEIIKNNPVPKPQEGEVVEFKRRKKEDGNLNNAKTLEQVYDYIRMLDCEGYPAAFLENDKFVFEFNKASIKNGKLTAKVIIKEKENG